jgi:integrase
LNSIALAAFQELFARSSGQGRVFVNMQGESLKGYKHWFDPALREAGISFFTWYCLRHTVASRLVMAGVDLRTVAELMGHKTNQMTMRYTHISRLLTNWLPSKGWQRGGRWIDQLTPELTPAVSSRNPASYGKPANSRRFC